MHNQGAGWCGLPLVGAMKSALSIEPKGNLFPDTAARVRCPISRVDSDAKGNYCQNKRLSGAFKQKTTINIQQNGRVVRLYCSQNQRKSGKTDLAASLSFYS